MLPFKPISNTVCLPDIDATLPDTSGIALSADSSAYRFPNSSHSKINFNRSTPELILSLRNPLIQCTTPTCGFVLPRIFDDPPTRVERERLIKQFLERNFENHLHQYAMNKVQTKAKLWNSSRVLTLLLEGITLEQLSSNSLADSNAQSLVRILFHDKRSLDIDPAKRALMALGPVGPMTVKEDREEMDKVLERVTAEGLTGPAGAYAWALGLRAMQVRHDREIAGSMHCLHGLFNLNAVRKLADQAFQPAQALQTFNEVIAVPVIKKIELYIQRGYLTGDDWQDPIRWKSSVISAMRIFFHSLNSATSSFVSTTPKFAAPYRHFVRNFPHLIQFVALRPTSQGDMGMEVISKWLEQGGLMSSDDPLLVQDGMVQTSTQKEKNARKEAKKLAKEVNAVDVEGEELKQMTDLNLDQMGMFRLTLSSIDLNISSADVLLPSSQVLPRRNH
jgi:hypothetical protein